MASDLIPRCDACGEMGFFGRWPKFQNEHGDDVIGAELCKPCYLNEDWATLATSIRARRSAPQPPVGGPKVVRARCGSPVTVGDRISCDGGIPRRVLEVGIRVDDQTWARCEGMDGLALNLEKFWDLSPPPTAQSDEGGGELMPGDRVRLRPSDMREAEVLGYYDANMVWLRMLDTKATVVACKLDCERVANTPGGSADAATVPAGEASAQPPGPSLAAFTATVEQHLLPRLPKGFRCITDSVCKDGTMFALWVLDECGVEVFACGTYVRMLKDYEWRSVASTIAGRLMSRLARPASERERGSG